MIRLEDTNGSAVAAAIAAERHRMGAVATGMVMTLLILADEEAQADATAAAVTAARQHPMRILTVVPRPGGDADRIDASIAVGGDDGPGELAVLRLRGELAQHAGSVVIPLLLSDTPVVAWWPHDAPSAPNADPIGRHAQRRITDCSTAADPLVTLALRRESYREGDTDLAWARCTPWRSVLASALDQAHSPIASAEVSSAAGDPSAVLLASWLSWALEVPVGVTAAGGPGLARVTLTTPAGDISVTRADATSATLTRPGSPDASVALPRRGLDDLIAEELRRLDPDEIYGTVLKAAAAYLPTPPGESHGADRP